MNDNHNIGCIFVSTVSHSGHFIFPQMWDAFSYDKAGKGKATKLDEMIDFIKERRSDCTSAFNTSINRWVMQEYEIIDLDRNGELSPWEHATYLKCRGVSAKDARKSYAAVDSNCDGKFSASDGSAKPFYAQIRYHS